MRSNNILFSLLFFLILVIGCKPNKEENNSIEGIWESMGYGEILKIDATSYEYFDITDFSCLPAKEGNISEVKNSMQVSNDTLIIKRGFNKYRYARIKELPDFCNQNSKDKNDISYNFEVFANTYKNHYAYFDLNKIDWDSLYINSKNKINSKSTEVDLYLVMEDMIEKLKDNHGSIEPTDEVYELAANQIQSEIAEEETEVLKKYGDFEIADIVADFYLKEDLTKNSWLMKWGKIENNVGYIQIKAMYLYADLNLNDSLVQENGFVSTYMDAFDRLSYEQQISEEVAGISKVMDSVMQDLKETKHIIIDVRFNGGGQDVVALEILRRFNSDRKQIAIKKARHNNGYTIKTPIYLEPTKQPYTKPVYLLTSQQSASATDMMALGSMELNNLKRIGSHTNGAISDALQKTLPNGWYFSLSNEVYTDNNDKCYENIGIPVHYELNYPNDRQTFFRSIANDLEKDKRNILNAVNVLQSK
ncbi:S41 family peptidase [Cellulophaga tyrosinoxydans]|uniref:Peptidase family S41 n=1 Tax=Cellulophaga tyrosinoxydans TaxID=504486 RepID=A0A1W2ACH3_9FLAO|nr:S41 family peptidase [Cellulophaga tyrosinoxydans]SMC57938.1 Peptidase family S41 [Cellulophaga tyrosinoxydans]